MNPPATSRLATSRLRVLSLALFVALGGLSACRGEAAGDGVAATDFDPSAGLAATGDPAGDQHVELAITGMT